MLDVSTMKTFLNNKELEVLLFGTIDSTNSEAKRIAKNGLQKPTLIIADSQSHGRGRMGRSFYSPSSTGLYFSYVYRPQGDVTSFVSVTSATAVAVCRAIKEVTSIDAKIKWVNDVYVDEKKVCGILCEAVTEGDKSDANCIIIGIGINVSTENFPSELSDKACSLKACGIDRNRLAAEVINQLEDLINGLENRAFIKEYRERSLVLGKPITFVKNGVETDAVAVSVDDDGGLTVRLSDGSQTTLNTGEISIKMQ